MNAQVHWLTDSLTHAELGPPRAVPAGWTTKVLKILPRMLLSKESSVEHAKCRGTHLAYTADYDVTEACF